MNMNRNRVTLLEHKAASIMDFCQEAGMTSKAVARVTKRDDDTKCIDGGCKENRGSPWQNEIVRRQPKGS